MLGDAQLVAFLPTTDLARARRFFREKLGLGLVDESAFACVFDANGVPVRVTPVESLPAAAFTVLGWRVDDIEDSVRSLRRRGIVFARFDGLDQDDFDTWRAPGGARVAWFADPDGNTLSLTEEPSP